MAQRHNMRTVMGHSWILDGHGAAKVSCRMLACCSTHLCAACLCCCCACTVSMILHAAWPLMPLMACRYRGMLQHAPTTSPTTTTTTLAAQYQEEEATTFTSAPTALATTSQRCGMLHILALRACLRCALRAWHGCMHATRKGTTGWHRITTSGSTVTQTSATASK